MDTRWLQRLDNFERALLNLERGLLFQESASTSLVDIRETFAAALRELHQELKKRIPR